MKLTGTSRLAAALIALFSVLFMQFAVAAYACPGYQIGQTDELVTMAASSLAYDASDCKGMDIEQPGLCDAHGQIGKQVFDKPELPQVQSFVAIRPVLALLRVDTAHQAPVAQSKSFLLTRATAPSLAIRNCCFRI
jgi:hypothetical protein